MAKPTICIGENKGADQLRSNCEADQRLCFRFSNSAVPLLSKYEISCFLQSSVTVQAGLCRTCSETTLLVFPRDGSFDEQIDFLLKFCYNAAIHDSSKFTSYGTVFILLVLSVCNFVHVELLLISVFNINIDVSGLYCKLFTYTSIVCLSL